MQNPEANPIGSVRHGALRANGRLCLGDEEASYVTSMLLAAPKLGAHMLTGPPPDSNFTKLPIPASHKTPFDCSRDHLPRPCSQWSLAENQRLQG